LAPILGKQTSGDALFLALAVTGFDVNRHRRVGKLRLDLLREILGDGVGILNRHQGLHLQMKLHETEMSRLSGAQVVITMNDRPLSTDCLADPLDLHPGQMDVQEIPGRLGGKVIGRLHDEQGHSQCHHRVQQVKIPAGAEPLRNPDQGQAPHDAGGGIDIGAEVPGVGLEGDGIRRPSHLEEHLRDTEINRRGNQHHPHPPADGRDRLGGDDFFHRLDNDPQGGGKDQEGLDGSGEVLDLAVTEGVPAVGGDAGGLHGK